MYPFKKIEKKWQNVWAKEKFRMWRAVDFLTSKVNSHMSKVYVLDMFPYPSGEGLHVGHVEGYTASDILSRYYRMKGFNVLHPMGWDAFGLPAENYAIKTKTHPVKVVSCNIANFKKQLQSLGFSYDWSREINTTDPEYYKWTQWIFLQLFKKGLAYEAEVSVNWCPSCKTVLANEEVMNGRCDRCSSFVEQRLLKQWLLKITAYADKLLSGLDELDWPEPVKEMQKNWIGRSEGAIIKFHVANAAGAEIEVFTTRPDTIFGATYMVLAPEHELVFRFSSDIANWKEVKKYIEKTKHKNQRDRTAAKIKTGIELKGIKAVNPANGKEIPVWIADYVLAGYGTGAIMAVPAHDERDFEFAQKFNLPIIQVIKPVISHQLSVVSLPYIGDGELINSGRFNGLSNLEAKDKIVKSLGVEKKIQYKIRDWVFSRQRYWGEPIPIIKCKNCGNVAVSEKDLPVKLPAVRKYEPTGRPESPLSDIAKWVNIKCPECGGSAKRETNTMPQWAGSSWYYLRYIDAKNKKYFVDSKKEHYWLPVDVYIGGVEHAVLHLLYARFWHKFLFDLGFVSGKEPFKKLVNQGLILGPDGQKMSKSRGNIVNPDAIVKEFGADSLRLYEMFMGPLEDQKPWDVKGIIGLFRFLTRVYKLMENAAFSEPRLWRGKLPPLASLAVGGKIEKTAIKNSVLERLLHQTIKKVTKDIESFKFNTAISALMILVNEMEKQESIVISYWSSVIKLLFPFAPHLAQELWQKLGNKTLLDKEKWPEWDEKLAAAETFELVIQINGKVRDKIEAPVGITEEEVRDMVIKMERVKIKLAGKEPKKIIYIRNRLVNLVV